MLFFCFEEGDGVDDVEVSLIEELHAFKIVIIQPSIALVITCCQNILTRFDLNHR